MKQGSGVQRSGAGVQGSEVRGQRDQLSVLNYQCEKTEIRRQGTEKQRSAISSQGSA